jgi:hypothetical protein
MEITRGATLIGVFNNGTLTNATPFVVAMTGHPMPSTVTLDSADAGRLIELSTDGGVNYFTPVIDATTTPMIAVALRAPVSHVRFTGAALDTWRVI